MKTIGKYKILAELGRGGMGIVYKALDPDINREVAIKTISDRLLDQADEGGKLIDQFLNEARAAGRLNHPHIVTIHEAGRQEGQTYIVMQHIEGQSLRKMIEEGRAFTLEEVIRIITGVCSALDYAHRQGIVHRDIKPDNILLDKENRPYVADFGIARIESAARTQQTTQTTATPSYMSPEQVKGAKIDRRSDIFSLGVILYELTAGKRPFTGENIGAIMNKIVSGEPEPVDKVRRGLPAGFASVVKKAMAKEPENRYASCAELSTALRSFLQAGDQTISFDTQKVQVDQTRRLGIKKLLSSRWKWAWLTGTAAVIIGLALILANTVFRPESQYASILSLVQFDYGAPDVPVNLMEYLLNRGLSASTAVPIFTQDDFSYYKKTTQPQEEVLPPLVSLSGQVTPGVAGFDVRITVVHKRSTAEQVFNCRGFHDLLANQLDRILEFIAQNSGGIVGRIEGNRAFTKICTGNWDALDHFLKGEAAWGKLDSDKAYAEYKTALEHDPDFSLARLRLADVQIFRGDRPEAAAELEAARQKGEGLIRLDLLRLQALDARLKSNPSAERDSLRQLVEAFPMKQEYHYEFAESYFHSAEAEEAIKHYLKALALNPSYALAHNHIAFCYAWLGDHARAENHFLKYVELDNTANAYDSLASGYMFAGRLDKALIAVEKGLQLDPHLDYLYGNLASILTVQGALSKAWQALDQEAAVTNRGTTRLSIDFDRAMIHFLRGHLDDAEVLLSRLRTAYSDPSYALRLDESPSLPFWLTGVIAARRGDQTLLRNMSALLEQKVRENDVNATNFFPLYKLSFHLKLLKASQAASDTEIQTLVEEMHRIKTKLGYWSSIYNLPFFLTQEAEILIGLVKTEPPGGLPGQSQTGLSLLHQARRLLQEALAYDANYAPARVAQARLLLKTGDRQAAARELEAARRLLDSSDRDYVLRQELERLERQPLGP
jgi:serine/threonine protein kinase/tetratricopeptide (TPR) repeat protein